MHSIVDPARRNTLRDNSVDLRTRTVSRQRGLGKDRTDKVSGEKGSRVSKLKSNDGGIIPKERRK